MVSAAEMSFSILRQDRDTVVLTKTAGVNPDHLFETSGNDQLSVLPNADQELVSKWGLYRGESLKLGMITAPMQNLAI